MSSQSLSSDDVLAEVQWKRSFLLCDEDVYTVLAKSLTLQWKVTVESLIPKCGALSSPHALGFTCKLLRLVERNVGDLKAIYS